MRRRQRDAICALEMSSETLDHIGASVSRNDAQRLFKIFEALDKYDHNVLQSFAF